MGELWKYFKPEYWSYFNDNVVKSELPKNMEFYKAIKEDNIFEDDIHKALASISKSMFQSKIENYQNWLHKKIPALDNYTPLEISKLPNGMNWIREYILRT